MNRERHEEVQTLPQYEIRQLAEIFAQLCWNWSMLQQRAQRLDPLHASTIHILQREGRSIADDLRSALPRRCLGADALQRYLQRLDGLLTSSHHCKMALKSARADPLALPGDQEIVEEMTQLLMKQEQHILALQQLLSL
jgi:hypothetical protein